MYGCANLSDLVHQGSCTGLSDVEVRDHVFKVNSVDAIISHVSVSIVCTSMCTFCSLSHMRVRLRTIRFIKNTWVDFPR